jgi:hypothetical protein
VTAFFSAIVVLSVAASCVLSSVVKADQTGMKGSRLVFSGAITESTCGLSMAEALMIADRTTRETTSSRLVCENTTGAATSVSRLYVSTESRLSDNESNPVLKYFDAYVMTEQPDAPHPILVMHVFE